MPSPLNRAEERRALRQELRSVARMLRVVGLVFALLGAAGVLLGIGHATWYRAPSWFSFLLGWALILAGVVTRVRNQRKRPDEL